MVLLFWGFALANMAAVLACVAQGVVGIRRGRPDVHARWMRRAAGLVALFLGAYVGKVVVGGSEDITTWSPAAVTNLRVHEGFVAMMLVAGAGALVLGRRLVDRLDDRAQAARAHRWLGRSAVLGAVFGFSTACMVFGGMLERLR